jgi:hypothetical protein
MPTPEFLTFTGIDERTDLDMVRALSADYPIEWGILFSASRQGNEPRYPSDNLLYQICGQLFDCRLSAHLCGNYTKLIMDEAADFPEIQIEKPYFCDPILELFERSQINHREPNIDLIRQKFGAHFPSVQPITQHRELTFPPYQGVQLLYDRSGGRGQLPDAWPEHPNDGQLIGFAGGLNADNIKEQNEKINSAGPYWLDMEGGIRTDDWLDLAKCQAVCEAIYG